MGQISEAPHGWTGDAAVYASDIENYMMLVPSGEENEEGFPSSCTKPRVPRFGGDVNAVWVPRWAATWSCTRPCRWCAQATQKGRSCLGHPLPQEGGN